MEQAKSFQQMALEQLDIYMQKTCESRHKPYSLHKSLLKIDHRPNVKHKTATFLEDT